MYVFKISDNSLEFSQNCHGHLRKKIGFEIGAYRRFLQMVYSVGVRRPWS